ncbi:hypothetical protein H4Q32_008209 [Labeo rohita]|uniref:Uncharacterized protein n=1 Tax=Labeo rohita TaxID=84645 RepID=A0ABQ8MCL7_LABRO|nr:hypothetical protein H4Q32_008209 [Labeo rohita]
MNILLSFIQPQVVPNLYDLHSSSQKKIFRRMLVTKQLLVATDFHSTKIYCVYLNISYTETSFTDTGKRSVSFSFLLHLV